MSQAEMEAAMRPMNGYKGVFIDARGRAGGLGVLWEANVGVTLLSYSLHHMDAPMKFEGEHLEWRFTGIYGWPETQYKWRTANVISDLKSHSNLPWLIGGDLNEIFYHSKKCGGQPKSQAQIDSFRDAFVDNGLFDLGYNGYSFTWHQTVGGQVVVEERLDRFCASVDWSLSYPEATVHHIDSDLSYHIPILLKCCSRQNPREQLDRSFRFENTWCADPSCMDIIKDAWSGGGEVDAMKNYMAKAEPCSQALRK